MRATWLSQMAWNTRTRRMSTAQAVTRDHLDTATSAPSLVSSQPVPESVVVEKERTDLPLPMRLDEVCTVLSEKDASIVAAKLLEAAESDPTRSHAVDTEVDNIDLSKVGPVGNGRVTCFSVYSGPDFDYGLGSGPGKTLWVETIEEQVLETFRPWFESSRARKIWHNYGFDRHVVNNHKIACGGFAGDTMHMARLYDSSRSRIKGGDGYSLEALSRDLIDGKMAKLPMKKLFKDFFQSQRAPKPSNREKKAALTAEESDSGGSVGDDEEAAITVSSKVSAGTIMQLQTNEKTRSDFICYSAYDAKSTWQVFQELQRRLQTTPWEPQVRDSKEQHEFENMWQFYQTFLVPFGELLTDMEAEGIHVDRDGHLAEVEVRAAADKLKANDIFRQWAVKRLGPDGNYINPGSSKQIQIFLFGGSQREPQKGGLSNERTDQGDNIPMQLDVLPTELDIDVPEDMFDDKSESDFLDPDEEVAVSPEEFFALASTAHLKAELKKRSLSTSGNKSEQIARLREHDNGDAMRAHDSGAAHDSADTGASTGQLADESLAREVNVESIANELMAQKRTNKELKEELKQLGLSTGGKKVILIDRLANAKYEALQKSNVNQETPGVVANDGEECSQQNVNEASKEAAAPENASNGGQYDAFENVYSEMTFEELCGHLKARGVQPPPTLERALELLKDDDDYIRQLQNLPAARATRKSDVVFDKAVRGASPSPNKDVVYMLPRKVVSKRTNGKRRVTIFAQGLEPIKYTASGWPSVTADVLRDLAGNPPETWGVAFEQFGCGENGKEACLALDALCRTGSIDTMLSTFIRPLRNLADEDSRVHCSLNLNTETGRLSSRRPNLQNQPALEKDNYQIRKAFRAPKGKSLIVADYGQLELRILAGITKCESMLVAFRDGGCFHSRTAVGMFDHVRHAVETGEVLLEKGLAGDDRPLVKEKFASERRKAKTLNFSIAYGKTAHGLAKDWDVSPEDAHDLLNAWYADRPEVKRWQEDTIRFARESGYITTLMGRRRNLPDIKSKARRIRGRAERAAINTPIQGSAADIVMMAMLKIHSSQVLAELGWKLVLQIHDEVILEGPEETASKALAEVRECMENPYDHRGLFPFNVDLVADAKTALSWYDAK